MVYYYAQILGTPTSDFDPSILLFFENKRYLFNTGEGSMRFCTEHKVKLGRIDHIFITNLQNECIGGLPGLLMTLADNGKKEISLFGPTNFLNFLQSLRFCLKRPFLTLSMTQVPISSSKIIFQDENVKVKGISISIKKETPKVDDKTVKHKFKIKDISKPLKHEFDEIEKKDEDNDETPRKKFKGTFLQESTFASPAPYESFIQYICYTPEIKGKFDPQKAKNLGMKPGPNFTKLSKGESVILEDGTVIKPEQVIGKSQKGCPLIIITCPNFEVMDQIVQLKDWEEFFNDEHSFILHITPLDVFSSDEYRKFMTKFGKNSQHSLSNRQVCSDKIMFFETSVLQCKLNMIHDKIFHIPNFSTSQKKVEDIKLKLEIAEPMLIYSMAPVPGFNYHSVIPTLNPQEIQKNLPDENPDLYKLIENFKKERYDHPEYDEKNEHEKILSGIKRGTVEVSFFGTGCALPSKYRNVTSIMINLFDDGAILMDTGEGTLGQIYRVYGNDAEKLIMNIKVIWISHLHGDHHLGLLKIMIHRQELLEKHKVKAPLIVISDKKMDKYIKEYQMYTFLKLDHEFINNQEIQDPKHSKL